MPDRRFIHTHPGFGYRFQPQPAPCAVSPQERAETPASFHEMFTSPQPAIKRLPAQDPTGGGSREAARSRKPG
jgi:hypothetical protein